MAENKHLFERYRKNKSQLKYNFNGYELDKILAMDLISEIYVNPPLKLKTLRYFFLAVDFSSMNSISPFKTLFSIGRYHRDDYYEILNYARSKTPQSVLIDLSKVKSIPHIKISNLVLAFSHIFKNTDLSFKSKLFLSCQLSYYLNSIDGVENKKISFKNYCAFSGVHHLEAIITFYFKKKNISTYSLQHGIYYVFKKHIPLDAILFENFLSDKQLCWGQYSIDEYNNYGIPKESLKLAGYPRNLIRKRIPSTLNKQKCLVLLARYTYEHSNVELINILKRFSLTHKIDISIKLHPTLNWQKYHDLCNSLGWQLIEKKYTLTNMFQENSFGWAIAINTAAYYEAYLNYLPCKRFNDGTFEDSLQVFDDNFENLKQLEEKFISIPFNHKKNLSEYFSKADERLKYILGLGIDNYNDINENS
ncbi:hypothetical protein [Maribacter sp. 1_2014MBL_MicDiv]|uniref:hypothetical protein n=1 Tax=Maribacter sp. 1_2014MBL_MicDiv TaxID=1644130 RepID=UPI0008F53A8F|nr:hypothetical protein [Maribacter sp. 1_2014MBL_MicDiv]APA64327.1 hypothetical protein YQ22_08360 [Maribacter sp. 1_2014MBL_MicDiv]